MKQCPHCNGLLEVLSISTAGSSICPHCHKILPLFTKRYFSIFGFVESFFIEDVRLQEMLYTLQSIYHPDKFAHCLPLEREVALQNSSVINQAYHVLKNPLTRAEYLLTSSGVDVQAAKAAPALIAESFGWRMRLEESATHEHLDKLLADMLNIESDALENLGKCFTKRLYEDALQVYTRLKFLQRFKQEIKNKSDCLDDDHNHL